MLIVVLTTVASMKDAEALAEKIVEAGLAACVQILPAMTSVYRWEGRLQRESEHLLLIKTTEDQYDELQSFLEQHHPYDVPEIVAIPALKVSPGYLDFVTSTTKAG